MRVGPQRGQIVNGRRPGTDTAAWPVALSGQDPYLLAFLAGVTLIVMPGSVVIRQVSAPTVRSAN